MSIDMTSILTEGVGVCCVHKDRAMVFGSCRSACRCLTWGLWPRDMVVFIWLCSGFMVDWMMANLVALLSHRKVVGSNSSNSGLRFFCMEVACSSPGTQTVQKHHCYVNWNWVLAWIAVCTVCFLPTSRPMNNGKGHRYPHDTNSWVEKLANYFMSMKKLPLLHKKKNYHFNRKKSELESVNVSESECLQMHHSSWGVSGCNCVQWSQSWTE